MIELLAQTPVSEIFGTIAAPVNDPTYTNPATGLSNLLTLGIRLFIIIATIIALVYMLWGALDWITSNGEKEALDKARQKITNAVIGIVLIVAALGIWILVSGNILNIMRRGPTGDWQFTLPTVQSQCIESGACNLNGPACCNGTCQLTPPSVVGVCP